MSQDFDLDLGSLWYTKLPPVFPVPSMRAKGPHTSTYAYCWEEDFSGLKKVLVASVRWTADLSTTKVHVTWKDSDPIHTVSARQKHLPPPAPLSADDLSRAHDTYGRNIATWSEGSLDQTVGDGECWSLVQHALQDLARTYRHHGQEPPLISQGRSHGYPLLSLRASSPGSTAGLLQLADVRRGDILELTGAHFRTVEAKAPAVRTTEWGTWQKGPGEKNVRMAHHTAVVAGVEGDVVRVIEQNGGVPMAVSAGKYDLREMQAGEMAVFRVVGERWCRPLDANWE